MANAPGITQDLSQSTMTASPPNNQGTDITDSTNPIAIRTKDTSKTIRKHHRESKQHVRDLKSKIKTLQSNNKRLKSKVKDYKATEKDNKKSASGIWYLELELKRQQRKTDRYIYKLAKERAERVAERAEHYKLAQTFAKERADRAIERAESDIIDRMLTKERAERAEEQDEREFDSLG